MNNKQTDIQSILTANTPPNTNLKDITATAAELNALSGVSSTVTPEALSTLTDGSSSVADSLHTHLVSTASDAELLDNLDSTQFLRSDASDTYTGATLTLDGDLSLASGGIFSTTSNGSITLNPNGTGEINLGLGENATIVTLTGDLSLTGDLFNESFFNLERQVSSLNAELAELQSSVMEPQVEQVDKQLSSVLNKYEALQQTIYIDKRKDVTIQNSMKLNGSLEVKGPIKLVKSSEKLGPITLYTDHSLKAYITMRGEGRLERGEAKIKLSPEFKEAVIIDAKHPLFVKTTLLSADCSELAVTKRTGTSFQVKEIYQGDSDCPFQWEASAQIKQ